MKRLKHRTLPLSDDKDAIYDYARFAYRYKHKARGRIKRKIFVGRDLFDHLYPDFWLGSMVTGLMEALDKDVQND